MGRFYETWAETDVEIAQAYALRVRMENLARCLRDVGALCAAFDLGHGHGFASCPCDGPRDDKFYEYADSQWRPGCHRPAPRGGE